MEQRGEEGGEQRGEGRGRAEGRGEQEGRAGERAEGGGPSQEDSMVRYVRPRWGPMLGSVCEESDDCLPLLSLAERQSAH